MADSDSVEQDRKSTPFISRALIGRFLAVGLFVALGTFAVIQSISGSKKKPHIDHAHGLVAGLDTELKDKSAILASTVKPKPPINTKPLVTKPKLGFGGSGKVIKPAVVVKPNKPGFANASHKITRPTSGFSFGDKPKPPIASVATKPTVTKPAALRPAPKGFNIGGPAKPPGPKPPERLAQAGSGGFAPKIGSNGFGVSSSGLRAPTKIGDSVNSVAKSAVQATSKSFGDLRSSVNSGAGSLLSAAKGTVNSTVGTVGAGANAAAGSAKKATSALSNPFDRPPAKPALAKPTASPAAVLRPVQSPNKNSGSLRSFADRRAPAKPEAKPPFAESRRSNAPGPFSNASTQRSQLSRPDKPTIKPAGRPGSSPTQLNARLASSRNTRGLNIPIGRFRNQSSQRWPCRR